MDWVIDLLHTKVFSYRHKPWLSLMLIGNNIVLNFHVCTIFAYTGSKLKPLSWKLWIYLMPLDWFLHCRLLVSDSNNLYNTLLDARNQSLPSCEPISYVRKALPTEKQCIKPMQRGISICIIPVLAQTVHKIHWWMCTPNPCVNWSPIWYSDARVSVCKLKHMCKAWPNEGQGLHVHTWERSWVRA